MSTVRYVKSFSKGQITIPKEFRDMLGFTSEFWLRLSLGENKIVAEPVEEKKMSREEWRKKILSIKGTWFDIDDYKKIRKEVEEKVKNDLKDLS